MSRNFFIDLVDSGKIRSKAELRSLYRHFVKKYHPDSKPERGKDIDFDELKREYREAASLLDRAVAAQAAAGGPFAYDASKFIGELRDLVARGLPVSAKALRKNKEYAKSMDYVSRCMDKLYKGAYGFAEMNEQVEFLYARIPRVYWYVLQVLWSCFDCSSGYAYAATIAERHLGCISHLLKGLGFEALDAFLVDLIKAASSTIAPPLKNPRI
jgi:hypothetical protein